MKYIEEMKEKVLAGALIKREEALALYDKPLEALCAAANQIREHFCSDIFDLCTIVNAKSGRCSEDCKFCAQSSFYHTDIDHFPLLGADEIVEQAKINADQGVLRYSIVTAGKALSDKEIDILCDVIRRIGSEVKISVCVSLGLLKEDQYRRLKSAGVSRVHNNLETSRNYFPQICTTHSFDDKVMAIKAAQSAGITVCSGGIMGLGESVVDRIDMALSLRELGVESVPLNLLNPIPGTPFSMRQKLNVEAMRRIVAVYRFILPKASIRLAGGRGLLGDLGESCFTSGANAAITGDMLTTSGITVEKDRHMVQAAGFQIGRMHG